MPFVSLPRMSVILSSSPFGLLAGICIGNGEFIHTSSSKGVMISRINDPYYWRKKFLFGTRVIN